MPKTRLGTPTMKHVLSMRIADRMVRTMPDAFASVVDPVA